VVKSAIFGGKNLRGAGLRNHTFESKSLVGHTSQPQSKPEVDSVENEKKLLVCRIWLFRRNLLVKKVYKKRIQKRREGEVGRGIVQGSSQNKAQSPFEIGSECDKSFEKRPEEVLSGRGRSRGVKHEIER